MKKCFILHLFFPILCLLLQQNIPCSQVVHPWALRSREISWGNWNYSRRSHIWCILPSLFAVLILVTEKSLPVLIVVVCAQSLQSCPTLCHPINCYLQGSSVSGVSPGKNTGMACHFLPQGIFPTQGSNQHLLHLLHPSGFFTTKCHSNNYCNRVRIWNWNIIWSHKGLLWQNVYANCPFYSFKNSLK